MEDLVQVMWLFVFIRPFVFGQIRYTVPEEKDPGTYIGNIATDLSLDNKILLTRQMRILSSPKGQHFDLNPVTGRLRIKDRLDREQLCGTSPVCLMNFEVMLENPVELHHVEVNILDINDNIPKFTKNETVLNISETVAPGALFPVAQAYDPDIGTNSITVYQLSPNKHFILKNPNPDDTNEFPELLLEKALDREKEKTHLLLLTVYDGGYHQHSAVSKITVNVLDANDNIPVFSQRQYVVSLPENSPKGSLVIKINATDLDEGTNAEIAYTFSANTAPKVQELFDLDSSTGAITLNGPVDFEEIKRFELYIQATDKGPNAEHAQCKIVAEITDMNDNSPEITVTSISKSILEDAPIGTIVAFFSVEDKDSGLNGQVSCRISDNLPFQLKPSLNNYYTVVTAMLLDRELISEYSVSIWASDKGLPVKSSYKTIRVQIGDVNDNPPRFSETSYELHVIENNFPGSAVGVVTAKDPDLGQNAKISYLFLGKQIKGEPLSTYFSVGAEDGIIYAMIPLDYEKVREYQFQIQARDAGVPQLSSMVTVYVYVIDANDNVPEILHPLPGKTSTGLEKIPRSVNAGHLVAKVSAVDADVGYNAWLSYQLLTSNVLELFTISKYTGEIRTRRQFQTNDSSTHTLVVLVKDEGQPALSATTVLHLTLTDNAPEVLPNVNRHFSSHEGISDMNMYLIICLLSITFLFFVIISVTVALRCYNSANLDLSISVCCNWKKNRAGRRQETNNFLPGPGHQGVQSYVEVQGRSSVYKVDTFRMSIPRELKNDFIIIDFPNANNSNPSNQQFQRMCLLCDDNSGAFSPPEVGTDIYLL
ncbi:protocadherin gamma-C5-like [Protopterus annectens]|uniref:protocadherin gamma-C5-like n=1 Tax=Protopterus annectens TaxID=7888 RepID=UPI001CFC32FC|nr:protocadherin gamma-C5-like [Protopterus annectens]